ncbi:ABC transporter permease [Sedimentibacter sp. MB31-C6]|uniref:ABC transporter permease n=1 Tax=Sedimentibacter sp. MB31-C6 TaxID=3109366 RepID=UPI002DDCA9A1|nr:ABC transporter permease [Sedimentibacter sp. MB36-C1]WSI05403.1 ABC transporter permease [Sedimentibacter sp. MB36-C1]
MKIISVIIKDLKIILSDKKALAIIILMPMILTTILSFALKGSFMSSDEFNIEAVNIAVVKLYDENEDSQMFDNILNSSFFSYENLPTDDEFNPETIFFEDFLNSKEVKKIITYSIEKESEALKLLDNGEVSAVVLLPNKFIYDMNINFLTPFRNKVDIKILTHPDRSINGQIVKSVFESYSNAMSSSIIGKNILIETALSNDIGNESFDNISDIMEDMNNVMKSININIDNVVVEGRKHITSAEYYAVAMMTMFILFAAGQGGRMLLEEKDNQTYQRMIIAGTSKLGLLSGKLITIFLIAIFQITVMITFSHFALKVQWGESSAIMLISLSAAFAVAGLGSFIGAATYKAGNYKMANIFENIIIQGMALLGGSFFPIDVMPEFMQKFSFLSLNGIALKAYLKVVTGYGISDVINYIFVLVITGILFSTLAVLVLREKGGNTDAQYNKIENIKA